MPARAAAFLVRIHVQIILMYANHLRNARLYVHDRTCIAYIQLHGPLNCAALHCTALLHECSCVQLLHSHYTEQSACRNGLDCTGHALSVSSLFSTAT